MLLLICSVIVYSLRLYGILYVLNVIYLCGTCILTFVARSLLEISFLISDFLPR